MLRKAKPSKVATKEEMHVIPPPKYTKINNAKLYRIVISRIASLNEKK